MPLSGAVTFATESSGAIQRSRSTVVLIYYEPIVQRRDGEFSRKAARQL